MPDSNEKADSKLLLESLIDGGFKAVLENKTICGLLKSELKELGCKPPFHIILFEGIKKTLVLGADFGGDILRKRLIEYLIKNKRVATLLGRVAQLCRETSDKSKLNDALIAELTGAKTLPELPTVDDGLNDQVLHQMYVRHRFETVDAELSGIAEALQDLLAGRSGEGIAPFLGWSEGSEASITDSIRYNSELHEFISRSDEIELLTGFCGDLSKIGPNNRFSWLLLTGPGGEGKTRLAHQFTTRLIGPQWAAGRLSVGDLAAFRHGDWVPRQPTMIVIDYPAQAPDAVHAMIANLARRRTQFDWPVRLLLLERDNDGEWFKTVFPSSSDGAALRRCVHVENGVSLLQGQALRPLSFSETMDIMRRRFESVGLYPADWEAIGTALLRIDDRMIDDGKGQGKAPHPRPLFAAAVGELMIAAINDGQAIDMEWALSLRRESIFRDIIERDREQHWRTRSASKTDLRRHELCVAFSTLCGGLARDKMRLLPDPILELLPSPAAVGETVLNPELCRAISGYEGGRVMPLEPDLIGELFLLDALDWIDGNAGEDVRRRFCAEAIAIAPDEAIDTAVRCAADYYDRVKQLNWFLPAPDAKVEALAGGTGICLALAHRTGVDGHALVDWASEIALAHPEDIVLAFNAVGALSNYIARVSDRGEVDRRDALLHQLDSLVALHPDDAVVANVAGRALSNAVLLDPHSDTAEQQDAILTRLDGLRARHPKSVGLAVIEAEVAGHDAAISIQDGARFDRLLMRLDQIAQDFAEVATVAAAVAAGRVMVTDGLTKLPEMTRLDQQINALADLRRTFPDNEDIAESQADAILNLSIAARNQHDSGARRAALQCMLDLGATLPDKARIGRREGQAINGFAADERAAGSSDWLEWTNECLKKLAERFPGDAMIAEQIAIARHNDALHASKNGDSKTYQHALNEVARLSTSFPDDVTLARILAHVTVIDIKAEFHANRPAKTGVEALEKIRARFPDDVELACIIVEICGILPEGHEEGQDSFEAPIALVAECWNSHRLAKELGESVAVAASNFCILFAKLENWERFDIIDGWLDIVVLQFPDNEEIARSIARAAITSTSRASKNADWARIDRLMARAGACRKRFPANDEIAESCARANVNLMIQAAEERDWNRAQTIWAEFDDLTLRHPANASIALLDAKASYTVIVDALESEQTQLLVPALMRLDSLRSRFPDDADISLRLMRGLAGVTAVASKVQDWGLVEKMLNRCRVLLQTGRAIHWPLVLNIWTTALLGYIRAGQAFTDGLAREYERIFAHTYNVDEGEGADALRASLVAVKALHQRRPTDATIHFTQILAKDGVDWARVADE